MMILVMKWTAVVPFSVYMIYVCERLIKKLDIFFINEGNGLTLESYYVAYFFLPPEKKGDFRCQLHRRIPSTF